MKLSHIFKVILLLLLPGFLLAQYPNNPVKSRLGWQTTGDGLVYRGSGAPAYSPGTLFNAWMYLDTTNYALYMYRNFQWTKLPLVNNGLTLDGSYVQLGGTLVENTQVERSTYTLDFGKISGTNFGYASFYGTDPHYFGVLTKKDGTESGLTIGNKVWGFEVDDASHVSSISGTRFGFDATYLGTLGVSQFKMDSARFFMRGLVSYASHTAADAAVGEYQLYKIDNSRAIYLKNSSVTSQDILGAGTATRIPIWSGSRLLGDSPILYNATTKRTTWDSPGVIELPMGTDAQRPSPATTSDFWYNTTGNGIEWYNGTRWAKGLESTFNRGTQYRIPHFDANGQVVDNSNFRYNYSNGYLYTPHIFSDKIQTYSNDIWINNGQSIANRIRYYTPSGTDNIQWYYVNNVYIGQFTAGSTQFAINHTGQIYIAQQGGILPYVTIGGSGVSIGNGTSVTASYPLHIQGASTIGLGRGTVAQRPTIIASTTPFWYNTDSTALEYGESVGVWRQLATRAYVRSLAVTDTWLGSRLASGSVSISEQTRDLRLGLRGLYIDSIYINSQTVPENTIILNRAFFPSGGITATTGNSNSVFNGLLAGSHGGFGNYAAHGATIYANSSGANFNNAQGISTVVYGEKNQAIGYNLTTGSSSSGKNTMYGRDITANNFSSTILIGDSLTATANGQVKIGNSLNNSQLFFGQKFIYDYDSFVLRLSEYGTGTEEASDLSKTQSNYIAGFATDGTVLDLERRRDTTVYVVDTDLDWSAAITTAQISRRYNRVIFLMTTTAAAGSDSDLTLHTPDVNLMQVEYLIRSTDEAGGFSNKIVFGSSNAVDSTNGLVTNYFPSAGQGVGIRAGLRSGVYKYFYY